MFVCVLFKITSKNSIKAIAYCLFILHLNLLLQRQVHPVISSIERTNMTDKLICHLNLVRPGNVETTGYNIT